MMHTCHPCYLSPVSRNHHGRRDTTADIGDTLPQWGFLDNYPLGGAAAIEVILFPFMPAVSVSVPPFSLDTTVGP